MISSNNLKQILTGLFNKNKEEHDKDINHLKTNMNKGWISSGTIEQLHGISDTSAPFDYYSEEEQLIGQWVDGKPLYRKYVYLGKNKDTDSVFSIDESTSMSIVNAIMLINNSSANLSITLACDACYENGKINVMGARNWTADNNRLIYAVIEYTKTTDTSIDKKEIVANGINMQLYDGTHYSEDELLIGQWVDGKPLYRKVVPFTYPAGSPYYEGDIEVIDVTDVENVWISDGWLDQGNDRSQLNNYYSSSFYCYTSVHKTDDKWYIYTRQAGFNNRNAVAIINYTKTTDTPFSVDEDIAWVALDSDVNDVLNNIGE